MKRYIRATQSKQILYEDSDVRIISGYSPDKVIVYHYTDYKTPLSGTNESGWLCSGTWRKYQDNLWYKWNEVSGGKLSEGANNFEEIADMIRSGRL